jgi:TonB family protein
VPAGIPLTIGHWMPSHEQTFGGGRPREIPASWRQIPRRLWQYQPKPRVILLGRDADKVPLPALVLEPGQSELGRHRLAVAGATTVLVHTAAAFWILSQPLGPKITTEEMQLALRYQTPTPLVAPPADLVRELTGGAPSIEEVSLGALMAQPGAVPNVPSVPIPVPPPTIAPPAVPVTPQPEPTPEAPPEPDPEPQIVEPSVIEPLEEPEPDPAPPGTPGPGSTSPPPAPPDPDSREKPVMAFERVGSGTFGTPTRSVSAPRTRSGNIGRASSPPPPVMPPPPSSNVQEAIREVSRRGGGGRGLIIGDVETAPGFFEPRGAAASKNNTGSNVKLLSDPKGVDFRPYLIRVLASVRRNWFAVMPESARLGRRGRVIIQFSIDRAGSVPKLVIATPSGAEPLDRAAVAGISASNPFPPLPADFPGDQVRLQLNFTYNTRQSNLR